jgi:hypothetical protein
MIMPDLWFHVDTTHGSYNAMKSDAATEHAIGAPGTVLSINTKKDGLEALVKICARDEYNPDWDTPPFVLNKFTDADHADAVTLVTHFDWVEPEPPRST